MDFKKIEWSGDWRKTAEVPFGLELEVVETKNGSFKWMVSSMYGDCSHKSGTRQTMQQAMESAERAYHKYVTENLERC